MFASSTAHSRELLDNGRARAENAPWWGRPAGRAQFDPGQNAVARRAYRSDEEVTAGVEVTPNNVARRRAFRTNDAFAELIRTGGAQQVEYRFRGRFHLLVCGGGIRNGGVSWVEGLPRSAMRDLRRRLTFVPAGCEYYERSHQQSAAPTLYVYFRSIGSASVTVHILRFLRPGPGLGVGCGLSGVRWACARARTGFYALRAPPIRSQPD